MKITIYTSVFGAYDTPGDLRPLPENVKAVCISDREYKGWESRIVQPLGLSKEELAKSNRLYKLKPWLVDSTCDINVYVDGCIKEIIWDKLFCLCETINDTDTHAIFIKHPREGGLTLPEIREVARQRKADIHKMLAQFKGYSLDGYRDEVHIIAANTQIRKTNSESLNNMLNFWWNEVNNGCHRDQISFGYSVWKTQFSKYKLITKEERGRIFIYGPHQLY